MEKYKFFSHKECDFFPCHEVKDPDKFNCLFCYCPLFALGDKCGGNYRYTENGIKDCSSCTLPHSEKAYDYIISKFGEIMEIAKANHEEGEK
ncbi:MAG: cysteine-rich small domain-containing protein [Bacillota bacterium]|nr:cysteine-rich small domain-containing protein [Bacillota bacterium]